MITPPVLDDEPDRQQVVDSLSRLAATRHPYLDELVELASFVCHMPVAALTLIDHDQVCFLSSLGVDTNRLASEGITELTRDASFCAHTIARDMLVVPDATQDERFADNPWVTGRPHIRFYAGQSIVVDGRRVGTICVLDCRPRTLLSDERRALEILGRQAAAQILLHRAD